MPPPQNPPILPHERPKPSPKLLSILLKALIMTLLTSSFFLFLGLAAFLLLSFCLLAAVYHRLCSPSTALLGPTRTAGRGIAPRDIKTLPHFRVPPCGSHQLGPESQCVVCLDGFRSGHWCRKLAACGHVFHRRCVDAWLLKVASCPTCRTPVRSYDAHQEGLGLGLDVNNGGRRRCDVEQHPAGTLVSGSLSL